MNLDDESQLSAFLDDELDPSDRLSVAWSVESSPPSTRLLAELQATQALLQGLDRPAIPLDLTAAILTELAFVKRARARRSRTGVARFAASLVGVASVAASLMLALILLHGKLHDNSMPWLFAAVNPDSPRTHSSGSLDLAAAAAPARTQPAATPSPVVVANHAGDMTPARSKTASPPVTPRPAEPAVFENPEPVRFAQVDAMLGHRKVFRALIVADGLQQAAQTVQSLIEADTAREPDFSRITLARGIVIDPDQPGEAEVYSMVVDEPSLRPFLARLRLAFPSMTLADETEPALVTQLTEVGQVAVFSDVRPSRLNTPPREVQALVATKGTTAHEPLLLSAAGPFDAKPPRPDELANSVEVTDQRVSKPDVARSGTVRSPSIRPVAPPTTIAPIAPIARHPEPVTVLVWVTRTPRP